MAQQPQSKWGNQPPPEAPTLEAVWKKPSEIVQKTGLKVLLWGEPEVGKTHCALTFPPPIYVVDTDIGVAPLLQHEEFKNKEIRILDAVALDLKTADLDPIKSIEQIEQAFGLLKDVNRGTIVIDTITDVWQWLGAWLEVAATYRAQDGKPYQFEWGKANLRYRKMVLRLMAKPINVVLIAQPTENYDTQGKALGTQRPRVQKQTGHMLDLVFYMRKDWDLATKGVKYMAQIQKCRYKRGYTEDIENLTYAAIIKVLKEKLGVTILEPPA